MPRNGPSKGARNDPENGKEGTRVPNYRVGAPDPLQVEIDRVDERVTDVLEKRVIPLEHYQEEHSHRLIGHDKQLRRRERGYEVYFALFGVALFALIVLQVVSFYQNRNHREDLAQELRFVSDSVQSIRNQTEGDQSYRLAVENQKLKEENQKLLAEVGHLKAESEVRAKTTKVLLEAAREVNWDEKRQKWVCNHE